ncbi:restriction endonuclease subunit S [Streptomyces sp. enrichment culture]|uniref:restriction endonuclease subunit S n=1 Tax=Streptomyces sp. enrichment culture TaxID=1795815 RepID=UPI003F568ABA
MSEGGVPSELPKGWARATLEDVVDVLDHLRVPVSAKERAARTGNVPYYGAAGQVGWIDEKIFDEDLVLLGEDGVQFFDADKPKAYLVSGPSWVNNHAHVLRARAGVVDRRYLAYYLNQFNYEGFANGTTRLKLTKSAMLRIPVLLPPLEEQRRIVAVLDGQLSRLDAAEQSLADAGHRIALTVRSLLNQYFGASGVRARGWRYERLEDVADIRGGQTPRKDAVEFHTVWAPGLVPFWKVGDMNGADGRLMARSRTYLSAEQITRAKVRTYPAGTVLLPKRGGAIATNKKRITATAGAFDLNVMGVVPREGLVPEFLWYWFRTVDLNELSDGSNVPQINKPDLSHLLVPVPDEAEQRSVVRHLDDLLGRFDRMQGTIEDVRPNRLRVSLLQRALAGRLAPQDPADESAEALLARLRAREEAGATRSRRPSARRTPAQRAGAEQAPPPPRPGAPALATATQPALDLEISS